MVCSPPTTTRAGRTNAPQPANRQDKVWLTDLEEAKKIAARENKSILIDFTGSDWCGWCIKLKKEVFSHDEFVKGASKHFVLVELDFPKKSNQTDEEKATNKALAKEYEVAAFPTIILTDAKGRKFGQTGYLGGGPAALSQAPHQTPGPQGSRVTPLFFRKGNTPTPSRSGATAAGLLFSGARRRRAPAGTGNSGRPRPGSMRKEASPAVPRAAVFPPEHPGDSPAGA